MRLKHIAAAVCLLVLATMPLRAQTLAANNAASPGLTPDGNPLPPVLSHSTNIVIHTTGGIVDASFETLAAFSFNVPDMTATNHPTIAETEKQIPAIIKALDGKTVRVHGFMMPVKEVQGKTTEFLITRSQPSCCFSGATEINEFVTVKVPAPGFETMMDDPVTIEGKLHVGAVTDTGFIVGLYVLDGEKLIPAGK